MTLSLGHLITGTSADHIWGRWGGARAWGYKLERDRFLVDSSLVSRSQERAGLHGLNPELQTLKLLVTGKWGRLGNKVHFIWASHWVRRCTGCQRNCEYSGWYPVKINALVVFGCIWGIRSSRPSYWPGLGLPRSWQNLLWELPNLPQAKVHIENGNIFIVQWSKWTLLIVKGDWSRLQLPQILPSHLRLRGLILQHAHGNLCFLERHFLTISHISFKLRDK